MTKPPSRKHYEKTKPTYKELENKLAILEHNAINEQQYSRELKNALNSLRVVSDWFDVLKRSEVMVLTPEGMKYLVGQDLEDYCKAEIEKQNENKVWWGDPVLPSSFAQHAREHLSKIIRDEIDNAAVTDTFKYSTKGRYVYDPRSKSKKEGS